jgi:hypothetical protein
MLLVCSFLRPAISAVSRYFLAIFGTDMLG